MEASGLSLWSSMVIVRTLTKHRLGRGRTARAKRRWCSKKGIKPGQRLGKRSVNDPQIGKDQRLTADQELTTKQPTDAVVSACMLYRLRALCLALQSRTNYEIFHAAAWLR